MDWGWLSIHRKGAAGNRATRPCGQSEKLKGSGNCQSSLQWSQVLLRARAGKDPGPGLGSPRAKSTKEQSQPQGLTERKGENCSRSAVGTAWEALRGVYSHFVPFCIHLAGVFYQKNNGHPVSKELFPVNMFQDQGVLSAITFFWKLMKRHWAAFWYKHIKFK